MKAMLPVIGGLCFGYFVLPSLPFLINVALLFVGCYLIIRDIAVDVNKRCANTGVISHARR
jgi:hypothetical protein